MSALRYHLVIPAAGIGSRFGGSIPKQYCAVAGRPLIEHAITATSQLPACASITVALAADDVYWQAPQTGIPVKRVGGGQERCDSVLAALERLLESGVSPQDWVWVHDAARPYVPHCDIEALLAHIQSHQQAAILASPVADTLKQVNAQGMVEHTVDRSNLWRALTPQAAPLGVLHSALLFCRDQGLSVTDEASALETAGHAVAIVKASAANIKVTLAEDLNTVASYLEAL